MIVLFQVATQFLRMYSPKKVKIFFLKKFQRFQQAIDSFVQSERILQDMNVALDRLDRFDENIVIRKW